MKLIITQPSEEYDFKESCIVPNKILAFNSRVNSLRYNKLMSVEQCIKSLELSELNFECYIIYILIRNDYVHPGVSLKEEHRKCLQKGELNLTY